MSLTVEACRCGCGGTGIYTSGLTKPCYHRWVYHGRPEIPPPPRLIAPCGTIAALRRHQRYGEPACKQCLAAGRIARTPAAGEQSIDGRPVRNGIPEAPRYRYRARAYPWAQRVLAAAEAVHGVPHDLAEATA